MKHAILFLAFAIIAAGCAAKTGTPDGSSAAADPYSCKADSDCVVKDIHNCCGYYPGCVNKNYAPDIEAVKRECKEKGIASICGFPDITGCKCSENKCVSMQGKDIIV